MKKRLLAVTMVVMLGLGLAACGGGGKKETVAPASETEAVESEAAQTETASPETEAETAAPETEAAQTDTAAAEEETAAVEEEAGTYYELSYMDDGNMQVDAETLHRMGAGYLLLRDDGTGVIVLLGDDPEELKWDENYIIANDNKVPYTMNGDVLRLEKDEVVMEFTKTTWGELNTAPEPIKPAEGYDPDHRQGYYKLASINADGQITDAAMLEAFGLSFYMVLNEDGSGNMVMFGEQVPLTWDDQSITIDGEAAAYVYMDGVISVVAESNTMDFVYAGTPEEAPEPETETEE